MIHLNEYIFSTLFRYCERRYDTVPKIIKDVDQKILKAATELFETDGYEKTEMKEIAKSAGTAVGNIYRYYSGKRALFIMVMKATFLNELEKLDVLSKAELTPAEKLKRFVHGFYSMMVKKRGMIQEFLKASSKERLCDMLPGDVDSPVNQKILVDRIEGFIGSIDNGECDMCFKGSERRLALSLLGMAWAMNIEFPTESDSNLEFLDSFIELIYKRT